jgi:uncharacterized protein YjiK
MGLARGLVFVPVLLISASQETEGGYFSCASGDPPVGVYAMPGRLEEISGLATTPDGRVLAHGDEEGRIFEVDPVSGRVVKEFRLRGRPRDDFEGIAAVPGGVLLMTSNGRLYRAPEGADGQEVAFRMTETGLGRYCELEGLGYDLATDVAFLPCKQVRDPRLEGRLVIFRWSVGRDSLARPAQLTVSGAALARLLRTSILRATSAEFDPDTRRLLVLSSTPAVVLEVDSTGVVVGGAPLDHRRHPQAEGLTLQDGHLLVADEGGRRAGGRRGTLTVYPCAP